MCGGPNPGGFELHVPLQLIRGATPAELSPKAIILLIHCLPPDLLHGSSDIGITALNLLQGDASYVKNFIGTRLPILVKRL